jgi:hypothetical protein
MKKPFIRAQALFRSYLILDPFVLIVISVITERTSVLGENALLSYFTTIPTKLVKLVREKELTDCIDLVTAHLGVNDEQAIAILKAWQDLGGVR